MLGRAGRNPGTRELVAQESYLRGYEVIQETGWTQDHANDQNILPAGPVTALQNQNVNTASY